MRGIMNYEFWIGHKLQACASGGHVSIVPIEWKGTISDKELGERIASTRKEWNNCSKL